MCYYQLQVILATAKQEPEKKPSPLGHPRALASRRKWQANA